MEKEFDYYRILKVDYAANFGFWLMIAPWFLYPLLSYGASSTLDIYWTLGLMLVCLIGFILMIRRMRFIKELYTHGADSVGHLVSISHDGYRKRQTMLELEHEYKAEKYKVLTDIRHSAFYKYHFRKGDNVIIRFNPKKPTEGIIRDAYFSLNGSTTPLFVPQLSESVTENKLTHLGADFIPSEFIFSDIWVSDRIDTNLSLQQFMNMVMEFSHQNYSVDEQRKDTDPK